MDRVQPDGGLRPGQVGHSSTSVVSQQTSHLLVIFTVVRVQVIVIVTIPAEAIEQHGYTVWPKG